MLREAPQGAFHSHGFSTNIIVNKFTVARRQSRSISQRFKMHSKITTKGHISQK